MVGGCTLAHAHASCCNQLSFLHPYLMFVHGILIDSRTLSIAWHLLQPIDKEHDGHTCRSSYSRLMCPLSHWKAGMVRSRKQIYRAIQTVNLPLLETRIRHFGIKTKHITSKTITTTTNPRSPLKSINANRLP